MVHNGGLLPCEENYESLEIDLAFAESEIGRLSKMLIEKNKEIKQLREQIMLITDEKSESDC